MTTPITIPDALKDVLNQFPTPTLNVPAHFALREIGFDFDVDSQLQAIGYILHRNKVAEADLAAQIKRAEQAAENPDWQASDCAIGHMESLVQDSVFQDAAHSLAAVGMLAPFLETVFTQCFRLIGSRWPTGSSPVGAHDRWKSSNAIQWDCHNVISNGRSRTDLVQGILQLADAIGLRQRLPSDIEATLSALFGYRNKMFHCGFEWPPEERIAFQKRIDTEKWPATWFATATSGGEPWIFYLTDEFIEHCLKTTDQVLTAFGEYVRHDLLSK